MVRARAAGEDEEDVEKQKIGRSDRKKVEMQRESKKQEELRKVQQE